MNNRGPEDTDLHLFQNAKQFMLALLEKQPIDPVLKRSWDEFYSIYTGIVRRFVLRQGVRGPDVDDCVQEVWHYVIKKLSTLERPVHRRGFRSWLYRVVASVSVDFFRQRARSPENLHHAADASESSSTSASLHVDGEQQEWRRSTIATLLDRIRTRISKTNYRLIEMRFLEGRSVAETAEALGLTHRQVWYRQHRVLIKIRALAAIYTGGMFRPVDSVDAP